MNIRENIRIAIFSIRTNLLRSLLTMLGIIIGVASVIAIITVGNGGRDYIVGMIQDMGQSAITIQVNQKNTSSSDYITDDDLKAMKGQDSIDYVSPFLLGMGTFKANSESGMCFPVGARQIWSRFQSFPQAMGACSLKRSTRRRATYVSSMV